MKSKSFTLIELLVVIVIIGILAGVIMISTSSSIDKANIAKLKVFDESVANDLAANMISRWKLDEVNGTSTPDAWGSNTGTLNGAAGTQNLPQLQLASQCVTDGCLKFDGYDDYISYTHDIIASSWTVSVWVNPVIPIIMDAPTYGIYAVFSGDYSERFLGFSNYCLTMYSTNVGTYAFSSNGGWHKLDYVYSSNGVLNGYVDGVKRGSASVVNVLGTSGYKRIGNRGDGLEIFKGSMDDLRVYNAALSSSQIKQNYIAGLDSLLSDGNISKEDYNQRINELAYE